MLALADAQRAVTTIAVFIATFLITLSLGRLLKRRAGVPFGIFFQLFALALSGYAAAWVYGLDPHWRNHLGALLILLSTTILVAFVDRYIWNAYFERRGIAVPKLLRDLVATLIFLITLMIVLSVGYHAETQLTGLLAGSGVLAIILGFAAQNLLSSVIAGLSLQIQRPYKVGDWLKVGDNYGEVMEIRWGATRLRTNDAITLHIPNNEMVKQTIVNLSYPSRAHYMRLYMGAEYGAPPNRVKEALLQAAIQAPGVEKHPPPQVFVSEYGESAIIYQIKFTMSTHSGYFETRDAIYTNAWYIFRRRKITIPFPIRTLEINRRQLGTPQQEHEQTKAILEGDALFNCLTSDQLDHLIGGSHRVHFGRGERIIEQGAEGASMFVLLQGAAGVSISLNGAMVQIGSLRMGDCFGEMSLMTGEKRTATVRAEEDCEVIEISKPAMAAVLREAPECVAQLSELLATRKMETEGLLKDAQQGVVEETKKREYRATFLRRVRAVFEL
ncbi:MAG: cyclic nucleotide-binding domain-containing protein [Chthoniobacterales bacterium]